MKQLELRTYTRKEIAEITGYEITNSNFSRNVRGTLMKWGYTFQWKHGGDVTIKEMPNTVEEKFRELMIRLFHFDVQIDEVAFAYMIFAFYEDVEGFCSMPWDSRVELLNTMFDCEFCKSSLSRWVRKLLQTDHVYKVRGRYWKTYSKNNKKIRECVDEDSEELKVYKTEMMEFLDEQRKRGLSFKEAFGMWRKKYWEEHQYCYYRCPLFDLNILAEDAEILYSATYAIAQKHMK